MRGDIRQYVEGNIKESTRTTEVGGVRVHAVEFGRAVHDSNLFGREARQAVAQHLLHIRRVIAEVDRVLRGYGRVSDGLRSIGAIEQ